VKHERPILETEFALDRSRLEGVVSPVVRSPVSAVWLRPRRVFRLKVHKTSQILISKYDPRKRLRQRVRFLDSHSWAQSVSGGNHSRRDCGEEVHSGRRRNGFREDYLRERDFACARPDRAARLPVIPSRDEEWREVTARDKSSRETTQSVHTLRESVLRVRDHFSPSDVEETGSATPLQPRWFRPSPKASPKTGQRRRR
jgi:hypothetical protein